MHIFVLNVLERYAYGQATAEELIRCILTLLQYDKTHSLITTFNKGRNQ